MYVRHRRDTHESAHPREQQLPKLKGVPNVEQFLERLKEVDKVLPISNPSIVVLNATQNIQMLIDIH